MSNGNSLQISAIGSLPVSLVFCAFYIFLAVCKILWEVRSSCTRKGGSDGIVWWTSNFIPYFYYEVVCAIRYFGWVLHPQMLSKLPCEIYTLIKQFHHIIQIVIKVGSNYQNSPTLCWCSFQPLIHVWNNNYLNIVWKICFIRNIHHLQKYFFFIY